MPKESIKDLNKELRAAKDRAYQAKRELDFANKEVESLEMEHLSIQNDLPGVGSEISTLISKLETIQHQVDRTQNNHEEYFDDLCNVMKILALRLKSV